jgi:hypothetical protein
MFRERISSVHQLLLDEDACLPGRFGESELGHIGAHKTVISGNQGDQSGVKGVTVTFGPVRVHEAIGGFSQGTDCRLCPGLPKRMPTGGSKPIVAIEE